MSDAGENFYRRDGFSTLPVRLARGEGHRLFDTAGKEYLDLCAGFGAISCGHANPTVVARMEAQLRAITAPAYFRSDILDQALAAIDARLPKGLHTVAIYNTGAEAIEQATRLARAMTGRQRFITFQGHFHGKTHGNMFLLKQYPGVYGPRPDGYCTTLEFGAPEQGPFSAEALDAALEAAAGDDLAGVVSEAAVGYSGPYALPDDFVPTLRRFCDRHGAKLIVDEVFTSFMRCGHWFLSGRAGHTPDILCFGKGLGNGMPVAALASTPLGAEKLPETAPGSTFSGNYLACAAIVGVAEVLSADPGLSARISACERFFFDAVQSKFPDPASQILPGGKGLLLGLRIGGRSAAEIMELFRAVLDAGVLVSFNPRGLRLSPPLTIPQAEFERGVQILLDVIAGHSDLRG